MDELDEMKNYQGILRYSRVSTSLLPPHLTSILSPFDSYLSISERFAVNISLKPNKGGVGRKRVGSSGSGGGGARLELPSYKQITRIETKQNFAPFLLQTL